MTQKETATAHKIISLILKKYSISRKSLLSRDRHYPLPEARKMMTMLLVDMLKDTTEARRLVMDFLNTSDHSAVCYNLTKGKDLITVYEEKQALYDQIRKEVTQWMESN